MSETDAEPGTTPAPTPAATAAPTPPAADASGRRARRVLTAVVSTAAVAIAAAGVARKRGSGSATLSPLGGIALGAASGVVGTLAFDVWLYLQYRRGGGTEPFPDWEFSADVTGWDNAPAPAQVGRRILDGVYEKTLPDSQAAPINNIAHWVYGLSGATAYGVVAGSLTRPRAGYGLLLGVAMWFSGYVILPPMHLYKPITEYDAKTLGKDLAAHLVYGSTTGAVFAMLHPGRRR